MPRALALAFAVAALALAAHLVYTGYVCGGRVVSEPCSGTEECARESRCVSRVHPFAPGYVAISLAGLAFAWRRQPAIALLAGVLGAAFGTLAGFSLGPHGLGISLLLVGAGIALAPRHPAAWSALVAALAPLPLLVLLALAGAQGMPLPLVWGVALAPAAAWLMLSAWMMRDRQAVTGTRG